MRYILLTCGIILLQLSFVNGQDWQWGQQLKSDGNVTPVDIVSDDLDNVYVAGKFDSGDLTIGTDLHTLAGDWDVFLASFASDGTYRWSVQLAGLGRDDIGALAISQAGILYVVGSFRDNPIYFTPTVSLPNVDNYDAFLAAYDSDGNFLYAKPLFWGTSTEKLTGITVNENNNSLGVIGNFKTELIYNNGVSDQTIIAIGGKDQFIAEFDINGNFQGISALTVTKKQTTLKDIAVCNDGGYFVGGDLRGSIDFDGAGSLTGDDTFMDVMLFRVDANLTYMWGVLGKATPTGTDDYDHVNSAVSDKFSNVYFVGKIASNPVIFESTDGGVSDPMDNIGLWDMFVAKYNRSGTLLWVHRIGSTGDDNAYGVNLFENQVQFAGNYAGQVIVNQDTLDSGSPGNTNTGFFVYDVDGNAVAAEEIIGDLDDKAQNLVININGKTLITGLFTSTSITAGPITLTNTNSPFSDGFLFKYGYNFTASIVKDKLITCNGTSDGQLIVSAFYGVPPFTYSWVGPDSFTSTNDTISDILAGTYTVTVTDFIGKTVVVSSTLNDPDPISVTPTITDVNCNGGDDGEISLVITGGTVSGDYIFSWSTTDGSGLIATDKDQTGLSVGTYSVKVTDDNGCYDSTAYVINEPVPFSFEGSVVTDILTPPGGNGAIALNVSNGVEPYAYLWVGPNGFTSTDKDLTGLVDGGSYEVAAMDDSGCSTDTIFSVNDNAAFLAFIINDSTKHVKCKGGTDGSATVTTTGGTAPYTWVWTDDGGNPVGLNDSVLNNASAGFYHVLVTDNDSKTANADVAISEPVTALAVIHDVTRDISCYGVADGAIDITITGGTLPYTYSWTGPNGYLSNQSDITNLGPGDYNILVTDANGCQEGIGSISVVEPPLLEVLSIDILQDVLCNGTLVGELEANPVGGSGDYSYLWDDLGHQNTKQATSLPAGTFTVTVTDENGCTALGNQTLSEPDEIMVIASVTDVSCFGGADGSIALTVSGGNEPYDFLWSPGSETTDVISGLTPGDYTVTITDANSCTKDTTISVIEPMEIIIDSVSVTDVLTCVGDATGKLVVHAIGGTAPLQYSIDGGVSFQADNIFPNLVAGNYDIAVSDVNTCTVMGNTVTIIDPVPLVIDAVTPTDVTGCADNTNGSLLIDVNGGTPPYEYSADGTLWQTESTILNLPVGEYTVMVRDANACTTTGEPVQILGPTAVAITSTIQDIICNLEANGEITIHASGGVGPYEYSNDGGTSFVADSVFVGLTPGQYSLVARDANSCLSTNEEIISITEPDAIVITSEDATHSCLGENTGSVIVEAIGGTGSLSYVLKKGANIVDQNTDGNFTGLKVGIYTVEVSDENDCGPVTSNNLQVKLSPTADCTIELYNAFSPNGDGINEEWTIHRIWNYPNSTVKIFNSWGSLVFNSAIGYPEKWDGTYNGKELPAGTYYYIIDLDNGEKPKSGTVNIVK